jgi:hypothetical protein
VSFLPVAWCPWQVEWHLAQAYRALVAHDEKGALERLTMINARGLNNPWALETEADIRYRRGEYALMRDLLQQVPETAKRPSALNSLAWLLATCPVPEMRNGPRAVELARQACEIDGWKNPALLDTLAAACAETGDFKSAEKWMVAAQEKPGGKDAVYAEHLAAFRAGRPWREAPPAPASTPAR